MLTLNELASDQSQGTETTKLALLKLLDYCATHDDSKIRYFSSEMVLHVHSDASYLPASRSRSRVGGHFFLINKILEGKQIRHNGAILEIAAILKNVMASAAVEELGELFLNGKETVDLRERLRETGNPQNEATPIQTDISTAMGIANNKTKQRRSKATDMRFHLVRDRTTQKLNFTILDTRRYKSSGSPQSVSFPIPPSKITTTTCIH